MTYAADERVDACIDALPDWQQAICRQVRDLIHAADPKMPETIKRARQPYFVLQGNICALLARDHVNVFLYDGGIVPDPDGISTAGHDSTTACTVAVRRGEVVNAPAFSAIFRHIIANNRAGGWRKLSAPVNPTCGPTRRARLPSTGRVGFGEDGVMKPGPADHVRIARPCHDLLAAERFWVGGLGWRCSSGSMSRPTATMP